MKRHLVTENQLLSKPVFLKPLLEIHAEVKTKIVILGIQHLQQLQPVFCHAMMFAQNAPDT